MVRKTTGQLNWAASQTRPDLAYDAFQLSTKLNHSTYRDAKNSKKAVMKAKKEHVPIKFGHLGKIEDLHIEAFADASLGNIDHNVHTKSMMGLVILLSNKNLDTSPLHWKAKVID